MTTAHEEMPTNRNATWLFEAAERFCCQIRPLCREENTSQSPREGLLTQKPVPRLLRPKDEKCAGEQEVLFAVLTQLT